MSSNGIDFVIGGKDKAGPAMASVGNSMKRLEAGTEKLKTSTQGLMAAMGPLLAVVAAVKTAMAAVGGIQAANAAYDESAEAVQGLETMLKIHNISLDEWSGKLQASAADLQKLTGVSDDATLAMMKQAFTMGVAVEDLDDMARAAVGLGEALGEDAASGMDKLRLAQEGNFKSFEKMFPAMKQMKSDEEKLSFVLDLAGKGLDAKAAASNRVAGMSGRASEAIGDLMESVGALLAPVRMLISQGLITLAESVSTLLVPAVAYAEEVLANIGPIMDWVKEKVIQGVNAIVAAFTFFEVILTNLGTVWDLVVTYAELYMEKISSVIMHTLTEVIPAYAVWFGENFGNMMRDAMMMAYTVVKNHMMKIIDAFKALWEFIKSGGTSDIMGKLGEISGRSYLEGFKSSLTALPTIAERTISEKEQALQDAAGQIGGSLGDEFARKMKERMIGMGDDVGNELDTGINLAMNAGQAKRKDGTLGQSINAMESRLITRGPGSTIPDKLDNIAGILERIEKKRGPRMVPAL